MTSVVEIVKGFVSLIVGMGVTIKAFFSPVVTVQYPRKTINITPRFRGHTKLVADSERPERTKCIVCGMCERNCPSKSIKKITGEKLEGEKKKTATQYILDFTTCSQCGICVETCPVDALEFSADYNPVGYKREDFHYDLVKEFEKRRQKL
ncbi:MAG TPA: 4Fe-4S dicluster domain-containing protein [Syntrophorhabdaceae bacterium]|jgi:NADH-quinone oxidoreductase subunit I|nr:4Fe-4S dicluster domain-containing protein [Syntrophorhabdaceae bacterium]MDI9562032.1 4Fe-4S dicluster domain-containing protein [Pseudomonadota bacterium]OQC47539.1 MAG: NADH-quinone oxidoreductase subunit I [Deltaproteobacteria bacterium ADurb.Bin026]MBP8699391.1 4Fe-4S dicluster domain-containing protein [Syntrophorhabdaceae bacterium]MBV6506336.1 NADH-quinone oxidoreductase subunit I [Syntrophorhabdaceae bacterium]